MSYNLGTDDNPIIVFVEFSGGMVDATLRCIDEAAFTAAARHAELFYETMATVVDPDTFEETQEGTGEWVQSKGIDITHLGPMMLTAGVYGDDGVETTAPTYDTRHHVNIRLSGTAATNIDGYGITKWHKWAMEWTMGGADGAQVNASESAKTLYGVDLIDNETIKSPARVWL